MTSTRDLDRILALPSNDPTSAPPRTAALADRLRAVQVSALAAIEQAPPQCGLFGEIGTGHGKTLVSLLTPHVLGVPGKHVLLMVPPELVVKTRRDQAQAAAIFPEVTEWPDVLSIGALSHPNSAGVLVQRSPRVVVIDEAHGFSDVRSARTRRFLAYLQGNPDTRVVLLSGTMGGKDLSRVAHLAEAALRDGSFLPISDNTLQAWAAVLDEDTDPSPEAVTALMPLARWAGEYVPTPTGPFGRVVAAGTADPRVAALRRAYTTRRTTARGVVATADVGVSTGLTFSKWRFEVPDVIHEALATLQDGWALPDGELLIAATDMSRHAQTLSWGFWYRQVYEHGDGVTLAQWKEARTAWGRALRRQLDYLDGYPGLDSPARVIGACRRGDAHPDTVRAWAAWTHIEKAVTVTREVVWLTQEAVDTAASKARSQRGITWYSSVALGEALAARGLNVYGAGSDQPPDTDPHPVCSLRAHGTGKNLQAWSHNLVLEVSPNAETWEQHVSRTHRSGQRADTVTVQITQATWAQRARLATARRRADHLNNATICPQRLCLGTWTN